MVKNSNSAKIQREEEELTCLLSNLPDNPIFWGNVVRLVAPILARLAVRYALKRTARALSEDKVNAVARQAGALVAGILDKRLPSG